MSDHLDAPGIKSPNMDSSVDICDIFIFQRPNDASRSVLVLNVNPVAPTHADSFSPEAVYELKVDTNGDAVADIAYRFTFSPKQNGKQMVTLRRVDGNKAKGAGDEGEILFNEAPVAFAGEATVAEGRGHRLFVGLRSDPFFFDLDGFKNGMQFTGKDTFLDKNVFSMVLEFPNDALGNNPQVGVWGRVLIPKDGDPFYQIDRMGRPFMNVAFTKGEDKVNYNHNEPSRDRELFTEKTAQILVEHGHDPESARQEVLNLLPDILSYDYTRPAEYPNGRKLTDDVIDVQLAMLTNGKVTTDKVGPHKDLLSEFPYLGPPHPLP